MLICEMLVCVLLGGKDTTILSNDIPQFKKLFTMRDMNMTI